MPQVVIVSSLGPQGPVGPQGLQGLTGSMAESNSGSFAITGSLTVSGSSTFTNIGPAIFSGSSNFTSLTASSALISGNVTVLGTASINTLIVNQTQLSTGSNQLGDAANDTQTLYGTVRVPTGSLTVSGSSYFTGSLSLGTGTVLYGDTANSSLILDQTTGAYLKYGTTSDIGLLGSITRLKASNTVQLQTGTTTHLIVSSSGNVGIGTTSPAANLEIKGSATALQLTTSDYVLGASGSRTIIGFGASTGNTYSRIQTTDAGGVSASDLVLQADSGNVGIGTTTPSVKLHVNANSANGVVANPLMVDGQSQSTLADGSGQVISFRGNLSRYWGAIGGFTAASKEGIGVFAGLSTSLPATPQLYINSDGNVGIGTTTPSASLDVRGNILIEGAGDNRLYLGAVISQTFSFGTVWNGVSDTMFLEYSALGTGKFVTFQGNGGKVGIGTTTPTGRLHVKGNGTTSSTSALLIENSNASASLVVLDNGYVGIGTSNPQGKLDVSAGLPSQTAGDLVVDTANNIVYIGKLDSVSNNTNLIFRDRLGSVKSKWANAGAGSVWFGNFSSGFGVGIQPLGITTETTIPGNAMFYVSKGNLGGTVASFINGNVGIGTTTPSASLHLSGSSGSVLLEVDSDSTQNILYVSGSGNIGIGTNTPTQKLDIDGAILVRSGNGVYFRDTVSYIYEGSGLNIVSGATRNIRLNAGGTDKLFVSSSGFVGIGTTTPIDLLNIRLNQNGVTQMRVENSNNDANSRASISVGSPGDALTIARYLSNYVNSSWANRGGILTDSGLTNGFFFRTATGSISFEPVSIERMRITSEGNVGIGTTTPTTTLDIQSTSTGSIRISGSAGSQITFVRPTAGLTGFVRYIGTSMDIGTVGSDGLNLYTSNTSRVAIQTNGDVLIGSGATPAGRLEVKGSGTTASTISLKVGNSTPAPSLVITDDLTSRFYGNVGIGALPTSGSLHISGAASTSSAAVYIYKSGSTTLDIQGSQGQLFSVTDALSGSLMSVNDISGLPILEVFSDDRVVMGSFASPALVVTGSAVRFPATGSTAPTYSGSNGETIFTVIGGNAFMYVWLGGRWRSGSLA